MRIQLLALGLIAALFVPSHALCQIAVARTEVAHSVKRVDLRFQLVEERNDAITQNALKWLPDFTAEFPELQGTIRTSSDPYAAPLHGDNKAVVERYIEWLTPRCSMIPQFAIGKEVSGQEQTVRYDLYVLEGMPWLTAADVADASIGYGDYGDIFVSVEFTKPGQQVFSELSGANVDRKLAIIWDGEVMSAPVIREQITGGKAQITLGAGSQEEQLDEAQRLASQLAGTYGAPPPEPPPPPMDSPDGEMLLGHIAWTLLAIPGFPTGHGLPVALIFLLGF